MATLDNFHTGNNPRPLYPALPARHAYIQEDLYGNRTWDPATDVPVAPVAPYNPASRVSAHPSPQLEERLTFRAMKDYLVPTRPATHFRYGDTVSGVQLFQEPERMGWLSRFLGRRARVAVPSRFHPYLR